MISKQFFRSSIILSLISVMFVIVPSAHGQVDTGTLSQASGFRSASSYTTFYTISQTAYSDTLWAPTNMIAWSDLTIVLSASYVAQDSLNIYSGGGLSSHLPVENVFVGTPFYPLLIDHVLPSSIRYKCSLIRGRYYIIIQLINNIINGNLSLRVTWWSQLQ